MANYIKEEVLCEAYTHLDIDLYGDKTALERLKSDLSSFMGERAKFFLGDDVTVSVEFEPGSLKTKITVLGTAATIVTAISGYGSFRSGVHQIAKDAAMLAQSANQEMIFRTRTAYCDRINVEKRKGIFGRVDALLAELDAVRPRLTEVAIPARPIDLKEYVGAVDRLIDWDAKADKLLGKLGTAEATACIAAGLLEDLERLPETAPWLDLLAQKSFRAEVLNSDPQRAAELAAAAAKYASIVKSLKSVMVRRIKSVAPRNA